MACSRWASNPGMILSGSEASAASRKTTMWSSAAWSDWSIQSMLPDMWQALRVTSTRWLTERSKAVALRRNEINKCKPQVAVGHRSIRWRSTCSFWTVTLRCELPGVQEDWIQWRVHRPDHVVHPLGQKMRSQASQCEDYNNVKLWWDALPWTDSFCHCNDVTQTGRRFDLCPWSHCHGNQLLSQSVADLCVK